MYLCLSSLRIKMGEQQEENVKEEKTSYLIAISIKFACGLR